MSLRVHFHPKSPLTWRLPEGEADEVEWGAWLHRYASFAWSYYERTDEEIEKLDEVRDWLYARMPERFREGVHVLQSGGGFMGEDIVAVDGHLDLSLHMRCTGCGLCSVVARHGEPWCYTCGEPAKEE